MPLMLCPNCNTAMSPVNRREVEFDICPSCRGVWLDRGELEKLVSSAEQTAAPDPFAGAPGRRPEPSRRYEPEPSRRYDHDHGDPRRKRRFDIFDIFD